MINGGVCDRRILRMNLVLMSKAVILSSEYGLHNHCLTIKVTESLLQPRAHLRVAHRGRSPALNMASLFNQASSDRSLRDRLPQS